MKPFVLTLAALAITALPLHAQEADQEEGFSLMEEGAKLFLRGILEEMDPAMDELRGLADDMQPALRQFVDEMGPALADLLGKVDDLNAYQAPEMLPNGDIILRRKIPEPLPDDGPSGEIEL